MPTVQQDGARQGPLQSVAALKRWVDRYLGETYGVIPMHRISGSLTTQQIGEKATSRADFDAHEADTTNVHGIADTAQVALKDAANTFTAAPQTFDTGTFRTVLTDGRVSVQNDAGSLYARVDIDQIQVNEGASTGLAEVSGSTGFAVSRQEAGQQAFASQREGETFQRYAMKSDGIPLGGTGGSAPTLAGFLTNLGISAFIQTLLNDADAATALATLTAAGTGTANTFTKKQIIAPDSDTHALDIRQGPGGTTPIFRIRNNADSTNIVNVSAVGRMTAQGFNAAGQTVENVADAAASHHAVSRSFGDGRFMRRDGATVDAESKRIINVSDATAATDAVNRQFADARYQPIFVAGAMGTVWPLIRADYGVASSSQASGTANRLFYVPVWIVRPCTLTGIRYRVGATASGSAKVALYNLAGTTQVAQASNATLQSVAGANAIASINFDSTAAVTSGLYWASVIFTQTTSTFSGWAATEYGAPAKAEDQGSHTNPTSITPPAQTSLPSNLVPWLVVY